MCKTAYFASLLITLSKTVRKMAEWLSGLVVVAEVVPGGGGSNDNDYGDYLSILTQ